MTFLEISFNKKAKAKIFPRQIFVTLSSKVYPDVAVYGTGIWMDEKLWAHFRPNQQWVDNNQKYCMNIVNDETRKVSQRFEESYDGLMDCYHRLRKVIGREPLPAEVMEFYIHELTGVRHKVLDLIPLYTTHHSGLAENTKKVYNNELTKLLTAYLKKYYTEDMQADLVTLEWAEKLEFYLLYEHLGIHTGKLLAPSSIKLYLEKTKAIFTLAKEKKLLKEDPLIDFRARQTTREMARALAKTQGDEYRKSITPAQLEFIETHPLPSNWDLDYHRDRLLILLQRWTGLSCVDMYKIGANIRNRIVKDLNGNDTLMYHRSKGGTQAIVPVFPETKVLLEQLNWNVNAGDVQTYAASIKKILKHYSMYKPGVSLAHMGRHLFGEAMLRRGFSYEAIAKMMGHTSTDQVRKTYAVIGKDRINGELEKIQKLETMVKNSMDEGIYLNRPA